MRENFAEAQTGFKGQYELFQRVHTLTGEPPLVIDGEYLKQNPNATVSKYFKYINQPMPADILKWKKGSRPDWVDRESWHIDAINSEEFTQVSSQIALKNLPQRVLEIINRDLFYFDKLSKYRLRV